MIDAAWVDGFCLVAGFILFGFLALLPVALT
jgi:hypothetical protein